MVKHCTLGVWQCRRLLDWCGQKPEYLKSTPRSSFHSASKTKQLQRASEADIDTFRAQVKSQNRGKKADRTTRIPKMKISVICATSATSNRACLKNAKWCATLQPATCYHLLTRLFSVQVLVVRTDLGMTKGALPYFQQRTWH